MQQLITGVFINLSRQDLAFDEQSPPSEEIVKTFSGAVLVVLLLEATSGLLSCFFMIFLLVKEFLKKNMMRYSWILIFLNVSNICYTCSLSIDSTINFLGLDLLHHTYLFCIISYMTMYSITSSLWFSAVLCIFYFMNIMPSQPGVLTTLKRSIGVIVWWLIIMTEVVAIGGSFLTILMYIPQINQRNSSVISSEMVEETSNQSLKFMTIVLILNSLPILIIMMTTIGSAWFLRIYSYHIQKNLTGNTHVRDYRESIQTMIGLLILYTTVLLFVILLMLNVFPYMTLGYIICQIFLFSFATVLSVLLIYGNPKLKEAAKQIFTL
ncbi:taste receptor type 2 member 39-like [Ranitomeya imitator]|uniref:taste receptor type 2 member 39-like n=1 Tax=Ranitomeya imitator TaxID=111125 RepID=UPI0037E82584